MAVVSKNEWKFGSDYSVALIPSNQICPSVKPVSRRDLTRDVSKAGVATLKDQEGMNLKISWRLRQLQGKKVLRCWPKYELMAQIIEQALPLLSETESYYFQKLSENVPLSFVVNQPEKLIYLFLEGPDSRPRFSTITITKKAIALPFDWKQRPFAVAYRMSQTDYYSDAQVDIVKTKRQARRFFNELNIIHSFDCFLQTRSEFCFKHVEGRFKFDKIVVIQDDYADAVNFHLHDVSEKNRVSIIRQLAGGLSLLHSAGRIHGSVKPLSIVFKKDSEGGFIFKWTDAGFSTTSVEYPQTVGFYGTLSSTPPENLGVPLPSPALLIPGENWAAGRCFLRLLGIPESRWELRIQSYFNTQRGVSPQQRDELIQQMTDEQDSLKQMIGTMAPSKTREIFQACVDLHAIDPDLRLTMPGVECRMDQLDQMGHLMDHAEEWLTIPQAVSDKSKRLSVFNEECVEQQLPGAVAPEENCPSISPSTILPSGPC